MRKLLFAASMLAVMVLVAAPALAQGGSGSGGGSASGAGSTSGGGGGGSASQAPAPADETPAFDTLAEEAAEEAGEGTPGAPDETPTVDTPAEEAAEEAVEPAPAPKAPAQKSGKLPNSGGVSPVALVSVAVLIAGAALEVVVLRRRG